MTLQYTAILAVIMTVGAAMSQEAGLPVRTTNSVGMVFALVPPGDFVMGSEDDPLASPPHEVRITRPFYIGITEVTQEQYFRIMQATPSYFKGTGSSRLPVEQVSYLDAALFCRKLSTMEPGVVYRLPTEAEWEYACGGEGTNWQGRVIKSADLEAYAWFDKNSTNRTHEVGMMNHGPFGLYDMHGNVWEWVADYADFFTTNSLAVTNPVCVKWKGKKKKEQRVLKGGCYGLPAGRCQSAVRIFLDENQTWAPFIGFRVVRVVSEVKTDVR
jgi:formylglycine-generating enzyme required for sulfatase activity